MRWVHRLCFASLSGLVAACWLLFVGCSPGGSREVAPPPSKEKDGPATRGKDTNPVAAPASGKDVATLVKGNNAFALKLYRRLVQRKPKEGLAFSPYGISESLTLLSLGTAGKTHKELARALGLGLEGDRLAAAYATLDAQILPGHVALRTPGWGLSVAADGSKGVKIEKVLPKGPAKTAGLSPGEVIIAVGGQPVRTVDDYFAALGRAGRAVVIETRFGENSSLSYHLRRDVDASDSGIRPYNLSIANALWAQKGIRFEPGFIRQARHGFGAAIEELDFEGKPQESAKTINRWIERRTDGVVKDLLGPKAPSKGTVLTLTNAIAFEAMWKEPFDEKRTDPKGTFRTLAGKEKTTPMMSQVIEARLFQNSKMGVKVLELGYKGGDVVMDLVLPMEVDGLPQIEKQLGELSTWVMSAKKREVAITLPRFVVGGKVNLLPVLKKMGVELAFTAGKADFSRLTARSRKDLAVGRILHAAEVRVDEKGTSAKGATTSEIIGKGLKYKFEANHPFLFLLRDPKTNAILFMGRVTDPIDPQKAS